MSTAASTPVGHPIVDYAGRWHAALDRLADTPGWSMTLAEQRSCW